ncbi:MAG: GNAT family N-acetyltransferase [Chloroflexi bacterium]|nr:GNAT family N-acetyltransferase [Chloroflexota bacterium]
MPITYTDSLDAVRADHLRGGFFDGWPDPPSPQTHLRILHGSAHVVLARTESGQVIGFITAISDGVLTAYIPLLEVLPAYRGQGVGAALVKRMLDKLHTRYMIDVVCDADVQPFYARFGFAPYTAAIRRNYDRQSGQ